MKRNKSFVVILVLIIVIMISGCQTNNANVGNSTDFTSDYHENTDIPTYGLAAGFTKTDDLTKNFDGSPISFQYTMYNPQASAEWGIEVYINGVLQTITVYSGDTVLVENTNMYTSFLNTQETQDIRIEFFPNIGNKGDTLELNVCSFLHPSYMLDSTDYVSFLPFHRMSPGSTMTINMQQSSENTVSVESFNGTYKDVPLEIQNSFNSINQFGNTINTFDKELVFDVFKSDETDQVIKFNDDNYNIVKIFGYGKPGNYRLSVYVNNQLVNAFGNSSYCDVEIKKGEEFVIDVPINIENNKNHIYVVAFDLESNKKETNDYIKSNTKLLLRE